MKPEVPIEYERGYTKFLNCPIDLSKKVFIPRVETEFWVKKAIKEIKLTTNNQQLTTKCIKVLDIFAGSGCIGVAILKNIKNSFVDFIDVDEKAISQIRINLKLNKIPRERCKIYKSNLFEKIKGEKYDFIFANPPYVAKEKLKEVQPSVLKYEPKKAIFGGKKGLYYIKKFLKRAKPFLAKTGVIFLEFDPEQRRDIEKIIKKVNYKRFKFFKDQFKKYRFVQLHN